MSPFYFDDGKYSASGGSWIDIIAEGAIARLFERDNLFFPKIKQIIKRSEKKKRTSITVRLLRNGHKLTKHVITR